MNEMIEARARWVCCPMCDKKKCDRTADDCDVKLYLNNKDNVNEEQVAENGNCCIVMLESENT